MKRREYVPRAWQPAITNFLDDNKRCGVWAGLGSGKTVSTLTMIARRYMCGELNSPVLVLAPLRVANSVWPQEVRMWSHLEGLSVSAVTGTLANRVAALKVPAQIFTINYENVPWLVEYLNGKWPFEMVIADESTRLKSFRTRQGGSRARALAAVAHTKIKEFKNLTGTPTPNGLKDLWGQVWFVDKGDRLGKSYNAYSQRWFKTDYSGFGLHPLAHADGEIHAKLNDTHLTVDIKDYVDIREPIVNNITVALPDKAMTLYKDMEKKFFMSLDSGHDIDAVNAAVKTQKLLQISSGCAYVDDAHVKFKELHDVKIQALESIINEASGAPILVAYNYKFDRDRILKQFKQARILDDNPATIEEWNGGRIPVLLAHPASAGHGLNLQHGGNTIVYFGVDWNLENYLQIQERLGPTRQMQSGYDRPVFVHHILSDTSIDRMVLKRLTSKKSVQDIILEAMKRR